jgi:hypothetical protein
MDIKNNYYFKSFEGINLVYNEYWDFNLIADKNGDLLPYITTCKESDSYGIITDKLVTWFDINNDDTTIDGSYLSSLIEWTATTITPSTGFTLNDWGLTGVDNGRVYCLSGESLVITSADTKLILYPVTGITVNYNFNSGCTVTNGLYTYNWAFHENNTIGDCTVGDTICLNGGFYQGFFKLDRDKPTPVKRLTDDNCGTTGYTLTYLSGVTENWQIMPTSYEDGWTMETWINWDNQFCLTGSTGLTLNNVYPNNSNFFFYIGTRSENKFWNNFSGETGLTTTTGIPLSLNETLLYDEKIVEPNSGQSWFTKSSKIGCICPCHNTCQTNDYTDKNIITGGQNWFDLGSNTVGCCSNCSGVTETTVVTGMSYSYCDQLSENALGFRITNDGRIGYRKLTVTGDCYNNKFRVTGTVMEEGYSEQYVIPTGNTWTHITVTYTPGGFKNTLPSGVLKFWINGLVKYRVEDFIGLQLRALNEWSDKQIGVPFNISWGGGTQGLAESQTFNGPDYNDRNLLIEQNFAGNFEGELSQLRFYEKPLNVLEIRNNFFVDCNRYCRPDTFGGALTVQPNYSMCTKCGTVVKPKYKPRVYYGKYINPTIDVIGVNSLLTQIITSVNNNYGITIPAGGGYGYILIPVDQAQPSDFVNSTTSCSGFNIPMITQSVITVTDVDGYDINYVVYRTFNYINGNINVWLCS